MALYPYSEIQTNNLGPLLTAARILAMLGYVLFISAVVLGFYGLFFDMPKAIELENNVRINLPADASFGVVMVTTLWGVVSAVMVLAFSGLCAAAVSCEHKYTSKPNTANED